MLDINGKQIEVGLTVKTTQPSNGILPPAEPTTGTVEECFDAFGNEALLIRTKADIMILLTGKINEVVSEK